MITANASDPFLMMQARRTREMLNSITTFKAVIKRETEEGAKLYYLLKRR
jgi:hypothetical protein